MRAYIRLPVTAVSELPHRIYSPFPSNLPIIWVKKLEKEEGTAPPPYIFCERDDGGFFLFCVVFKSLRCTFRTQYASAAAAAGILSLGAA